LALLPPPVKASREAELAARQRKLAQSMLPVDFFTVEPPA
jgi:hypothetical protein